MQTPASTIIHIAPARKSWHGNNLQNDTDGLPCYPDLTEREITLAEALERIVLEAMDYTPVRRLDGDSYLPSFMVNQAQAALATCGMRVKSYQEAAA